MKNQIERIGLVFLALAAAGVAPNLFVVAQAGFAPLSVLAVRLLIPSIVIIAAVLLVAHLRGHEALARQIRIGILGGLFATLGLEVVRHVGFLMGGMPGEMPKLLGVLLLDRFALGPNLVSNLAGWGYHFWNGAAFGILYSLIFGRGKVWLGIVYGLVIGVGFMASPAATALGVGRFGVEFGIGFPLTVSLAHVAFGTLLGVFVAKKNWQAVPLPGRLTQLFCAQQAHPVGQHS